MNEAHDTRTTQSVFDALAAAKRHAEPFTYWLFDTAFPADVRDELLALPIATPEIEHDSGRRESHNSTRFFMNPETRAAYPACAAVARAFQDAKVTALVERVCGIDLEGSWLRIEYTQDTEGFWLERHTDIREKLFTMLVYLSTEPTAADYGTDLYDCAGNHVGRAPYGSNNGLIFIPGDDTWHGFERRPMPTVRRSLIINYVTNAWRDRFELAYPDAPIGKPRVA